jgi:hypothetical protein
MIGERRMLGIARILFGALVLLRTTPLLAPLHVGFLQDAAPLLGWPTSAWHVAAFGLALPAGLVATLCIVRTLATIAFTVGMHAREAGTLAGIVGWIVLTQDAFAYINTLHLLFLGMIVLAMGDAGSAVALRAQVAVDPPSGVGLVRALVVSVYAWSGLAKLNPSWLRGTALAQFHDYGMVRGPFADAMLASASGRVAAAWVTAAVEIALGPLLVLRRTRLIAVVLALTLHASIEASVHPDFFGLGMAVLLLAFVDLDAQFTGNRAAMPPTAPATR